MATKRKDAKAGPAAGKAARAEGARARPAATADTMAVPAGRAEPPPLAAPAAPGLRSPFITAEQLQKIPAFSELRPEDLRELLRALRERPVARGERIFAQGAAGEGLFAVLSGRVSIVKRNAKGGEREVAVLEKDEVFGEMDLLSERPHTAGAVAAESSRLLFLPKAAFHEMLSAGNRGAIEMLKYFTRMLAARLDSANRRMMEILERPGGAPRTSEFAEFKRRLLREWTF